MKRDRIYKNIILISMTLAAAMLFLVLYFDLERRREAKGLTEDKDIYMKDNNIYYVYISVYQTEND